MSNPYKTFCHAMRSTNCTEYVDHARNLLGYVTCMACGDMIAHERRFTIAPINKSNYMLITDLSQLKQLNPKRT
jgi:hypothetical protein